MPTESAYSTLPGLRQLAWDNPGYHVFLMSNLIGIGPSRMPTGMPLKELEAHVLKLEDGRSLAEFSRLYAPQAPECSITIRIYPEGSPPEDHSLSFAQTSGSS